MAKRKAKPARSPQTLDPQQQQMVQALGIDLSKLDWKQLYDVLLVIISLWKSVQALPASVAQAVKEHGGNDALVESLHDALALNLEAAEVLAGAIADECGW